MRERSIIGAVGVALCSFCLLPGCNARTNETPRVTVVHPQVRDVTLRQQYPCQILALHHVKISASLRGFLEEVPIKAGQEVKEGDPLFTIATRSKQSKSDKAQARLTSYTLTAPFDGCIDRVHHPEGSFVREGETLSTLSDNQALRVYFDVPEQQYLQYMADTRHHPEELQVALVMANGKPFNQPGKISSIDAAFNDTSKTIAFRADFPNPDRILRHGQTGTVLLSHAMNEALVVPSRATFEVLNKRYVYVVGSDDVVHRREIVAQSEIENDLVVKKGIGTSDQIVLEGLRQIHDGEKVSVAVN